MIATFLSLKRGIVTVNKLNVEIRALDSTRRQLDNEKLVEWALVLEGPPKYEQGGSGGGGDFIVAGYSGDAGSMYGAAEQIVIVPHSVGAQCETPPEALSIFNNDKTGALAKVAIHLIAGYAARHTDEMWRAQFKHIGDKLLVVKANAAPGASGGGVFNNKGEMVGVTTTTSRSLAGQ